MKIVVTADVLVRAVLRGHAPPSAAEQLMANAETIAVPTASLCEFVEVLRQNYALEPPDIAAAVRALLNTPRVKADRTTAAAGLAVLESGGSFSAGVVAFEGMGLGANRFVSLDMDSVARVEGVMPQYR